MTLKALALVAALATSTFLSAAAHADVVAFTGSPSTSFADGTFSTNLSSNLPDGFYSLGPTSANNGFGQNGESIFFNSAVTLNSLVLQKCASCGDTDPISFTASLFDGSSMLLSSQTIAASYVPSTLLFNTSGVKTLTLTFDGGQDVFGTGQNAAWYAVSDVTYTALATPEPETWTMMIVGFGMVGGMIRAKRRSTLVLR